MENTAEFAQEKNLSSEKFLTKELHITQLPNEFSFNDEVKYGLLSFEKWTKASDKEVSGVIYIDTKDKIRMKELQKGETWAVRIHKHDLGNFSDEQINKYLNKNLYSAEGFNKDFFLLPENYSNVKTTSQGFHIKRLPREHIIERGKRILGSIHTHPSENPPSSGDFNHIILEASEYDRECLNGIISADNLYLMLKTKETSLLEIREGTEGLYNKEMDKEEEKLTEKGFSLKDAMEKTLVDHCYQNNVALYKGKISENIYKRII